ncbi:hypothetical protein SAMN02194393_01981 [Maledivibacter halophilus]|uniref:Uncharacterized protein n=1 Tax=Maledivibacter halophilus TaxID=36842 RepID=A0A1T5KNV6_9FIRM|nr:hypothetical protein SAMN02194393_01981 [Maledivibacter halophilus]
MMDSLFAFDGINKYFLKTNYRYSSKIVNLYTSKLLRNTGYFDINELNFLMGNLYKCTPIKV